MSIAKSFLLTYLLAILLSVSLTYFTYQRLTSQSAHLLLIIGTAVFYLLFYVIIHRSRPSWHLMIASSYLTWMSTLLLFRISHFSTTGWNFIPFVNSVTMLKNLSMTEMIWYFGGNTLLFIPIGFLFATLTQSLKKSILSGFFIMLFVEIIQGVMGLGVFDVDDLLLNMLGIAAGVVSCISCQKLDKIKQGKGSKTIKI